MPRDLLVEALALTLPQWWNSCEGSEACQKYANLGLCVAYAAVALIALVQLVRIQVRVPEYGWTTQKVFHLLNGLVSGLRAAIFLYRFTLLPLQQLPPPPTAPPSLLPAPPPGGPLSLHALWLGDPALPLPSVLPLVLMDLPGLMFFTTYTLLVLFWAEIYHQARSIPTGALRPIFIGLNVGVYLVQGGLWALALYGSGTLQLLGTLGSDVFLGLVSLAAALSFLLYGGRLFLMLRRFPIESRGRRKKLREVGLVTGICTFCFALRAALIASAAWDSADFELDLMAHPLPNLVYYGMVEVLPSACVLFILRKLPPKRNTQGYTAIPTN